MNDLVIYVNPNCSKCRTALDAIDSAGKSPEVVKYLDSPPSRETLMEIAGILTDSVQDMVRKDRRFNELGLVANDYQDAESIVELLLQYPELMQRPIIVREGKAYIARSPETLGMAIAAA